MRVTVQRCCADPLRNCSQILSRSCYSRLAHVPGSIRQSGTAAPMLTCSWLPWNKSSGGLRTESSATSVETHSGLQQLFTVASSAARSRSVSDDMQQAVASALARIPVDQLGLKDEHATWAKGFATHHTNRTIDYLHVHEDEAMSIGIFKIPAGGTLPLHNHPTMTVWSRVLYGSIQIRAFDLCGEIYKSEDQDCTARLKVDQCFSSFDPPALLTPTSCNVHSLTAKEDAAVLDILIPPYRIGGGRDCTYYTEMDPIAASLGAYCILRVSEPDESFKVVRRSYLGDHVKP